MKELLREKSSVSSKDLIDRSRIGQTLNVFVEEKILVVSDKLHCIAVFLTDECIDDFKTNYGNRQIKSLRHSLVKLDKWHISTTIQCAGQRASTFQKEHNITFPIAIQCRKITCLEANDGVVIGDPIDVNQDPEMRAILSRLTYITIVSRFSERQMVNNHNTLPDASGLSCIPRQYSEDYPLRPHHCEIPIGQQTEINQLKQAMNLVESQQDGTLIDQTQFDETLIDDGMLDVDLCGEENQNMYADMLPPPSHVIDISHRIQKTPPTSSSASHVTTTSQQPRVVNSTQNISNGIQSPVEWLTQPLNDDTLDHMQNWLLTQTAPLELTPTSQGKSQLKNAVAFDPNAVVSQDYDVTQSSADSAAVFQTAAATSLPVERVDANSIIGKTFWKKFPDGQYFKGEVIFYSE